MRPRRDLVRAPLWAAVGFLAVRACLAWTLLVVLVCWPLAVVWWLLRGDEDPPARRHL